MFLEDFVNRLYAHALGIDELDTNECSGFVEVQDHLRFDALTLMNLLAVCADRPSIRIGPHFGCLFLHRVTSRLHVTLTSANQASFLWTC